ncbi:hypothetical protein Tco_1567637, partial [Tanacetum coccineum]
DMMSVDGKAWVDDDDDDDDDDGGDDTDYDATLPLQLATATSCESIDERLLNESLSEESSDALEESEECKNEEMIGASGA